MSNRIKSDSRTELAMDVAMLVEARLATMPTKVIEADRTVLDAGKAACEALTRLEQAKYTPGEPAARLALERAVRSLRRRMKERRHV